MNAEKFHDDVNLHTYVIDRMLDLLLSGKSRKTSRLHILKTIKIECNKIIELTEEEMKTCCTSVLNLQKFPEISRN